MRRSVPDAVVGVGTITRERDFVDDVADHLRVREAVALGVDGHVAEGVESEFELLRHGRCNRMDSGVIPPPPHRKSAV